MTAGRPISEGDPDRPTEDDIRRELENPRDIDPIEDGDAEGRGGDDENDRSGVRADYGVERGVIFPGSVVEALGKDGKTCWVLDHLGQLIGFSQFQRSEVMNAYGGSTQRAILMENFPAFHKQSQAEAEAGMPPKVRDIDFAKLNEAIMRACGERGLFSATNKVRGPGCWRDQDGGLVFHAGPKILFRGEWVSPGVHEDKVYSASPAIPMPSLRSNDGAAEDTLAAFKTWNWRRPAIDPVLALGFFGVQFLGGALEWRPCGYLTGDAAAGKSTFLKLVSALHGGDDGLLLCTDTTEAGIRSIIGQSSLPVAIDEAEFDVDNPAKMKGIIRLIRSMVSGGNIFRGSADQKGVQQRAFSTPMLSSIIVTISEAQDLQRMVMLELDPLPPDADMPTMNPQKWRAIGGHLKRVLIDRWSEFAGRLEAYEVALSRSGNSGRAALTYGTLLACADLMLYDEAPDQGRLDEWTALLTKEMLAEQVDTGSNAESFAIWLLTRNLDPFRRGQQRTIAHWLSGAALLPGCDDFLTHADEGAHLGPDRMKRYNDILASFGLKVVGEGADARLLIARRPEIAGLRDLFDDSAWREGGWNQAARRLPGAQPGASSIRFNGVASRYTEIPFRSLSGLVPASDRREGAGREPDFTDI